MLGSVRCANPKCGKVREPGHISCPHCATATVIISFYWQGRHRKVRRDRQTNKTFRDARRAFDILSEIRLSINDGTFRMEDWDPRQFQARKVGLQADEWLRLKQAEAEAGEISFGTIKDYRGYVNNYFRPLLGDTDARTIGHRDIQIFKDRLPEFALNEYGYRLKIKTRRNILNALHAFFGWMHRQGTIADMPPFPQIKGGDSVEREALTIEQQAAALDNFPESEREARDAVEFSMELGLRNGELCALKVGDINPFNRRALIQRTYSDAILVEHTKGRRSFWMPITEQAWPIVEARIKDRHPDEFLFINPRTGRGFRPKVILRLWKEYSGTGTVHHEASRHSYITQLNESEGASMYDMQQLARHQHISTTQKYCHRNDARLSQAAEARRAPAGKKSIRRVK